LYRIKIKDFIKHINSKEINKAIKTYKESFTKLIKILSNKIVLNNWIWKKILINKILKKFYSSYKYWFHIILFTKLKNISNTIEKVYVFNNFYRIITKNNKNDVCFNEAKSLISKFISDYYD